VAPFAVYYAAHGALGDLFEAVFARAAALSDAFPPPWSVLASLGAGEGRIVAVLMLVPIALAALFAVGIAARWRRRGLDSDVALRGALLAFACATLSQAYHPVLLARLLQSALCFQVIATIALADAAARVDGSTRRGVELGGIGLAALYAVLVLAGVPRVHPGEQYTGSLRMRSYDTPVEVFGETLYTPFMQADEIRLVRAFCASHTRPGEPIAVLPTHPLYWVLVDRPSPMRFLADHAHGNFVMSVEQKRVEAERLAASDARYVLAEPEWFSASGPDDPFRDLLEAQFRPVRAYHSMLVLERGRKPDTAALTAILRRITIGVPRAGDLAALRAMAAADPDEPLVHKLRATLAAQAGAVDEAIEAQHRVAALDPADATALERSTALLLHQGRTAEAAADLQRARSIRESPTSRALASGVEANVTD
jgi:hypothetical protein